MKILILFIALISNCFAGKFNLSDLASYLDTNLKSSLLNTGKSHFKNSYTVALPALTYKNNLGRVVVRQFPLVRFSFIEDENHVMIVINTTPLQQEQDKMHTAIQLVEELKSKFPEIKYVLIPSTEFKNMKVKLGIPLRLIQDEDQLQVLTNNIFQATIDFFQPVTLK